MYCYGKLLSGWCSSSKTNFESCRETRTCNHNEHNTCFRSHSAFGTKWFYLHPAGRTAQLWTDGRPESSKQLHSFHFIYRYTNVFDCRRLLYAGTPTCSWRTKKSRTYLLPIQSDAECEFHDLNISSRLLFLSKTPPAYHVSKSHSTLAAMLYPLLSSFFHACTSILSPDFSSTV